MIRFTLISAIASSLCVPAWCADTAGVVSPLLKKAAAQVEKFEDQFAAVACTEKVVQTKLGENNKVILRKESNYDYLVLFQSADGNVQVDESRLRKGKEQKPANRALLETSGFATLLLIFHPAFRSAFHFEDEGPDPMTGLERVRFEHIRGQRSPAALALRGRNYPIDWQGTAWIDAATGHIGRISAGLEAPMDDVGLKKLTSDVHYAPVNFSSDPKFTAWLPETAVVEAGTVHQQWRNEHQFSHYRQFSVDATSATEAPK